jgi:hypothetical protein
MSKLPSFQFYPGDWMKDPELRLCSMFARGLLVDLLCIMFEAKHRGRLVLADDATPWTDLQIVDAVTGGDREEKLTALRDLLQNGVLKRDEQGIVYSKRLLADETLRRERSKAGSKGGSKTQATRQANGAAKHQAKSSPSTSSSSSTSVSKHKGNSFKIPTVDEVRSYCLERNNSVDPQEFVDHYGANGWVRGKTKMKNWKLAVHTWEKNSNGTNKQPQQRLTAAQQREQGNADAFKAVFGDGDGTDAALFDEESGPVHPAPAGYLGESP